MRLMLGPLVLGLAGCAALTPQPVVEAVPASSPVELPPPPPPPPPVGANTAEEFDTTTEEQRAAALEVPEASARALGTTIATLGPPAEPGIWIQTPLVSAVTMGRADYPKGGTSVALELRPSGGDAGSGSEISLAAMRLLEVPLTELAELTLYAD